MAEAVGFEASVLQITASCVKAVDAIDTLRQSYKSAPDSIEALYSESSAIHASLSELTHWAEQRDENLVHALGTKPELKRALRIALSGCRTVFALLRQKLQDIIPKIGREGNFLGIKRRASLMRSHDLLKGYLAQVQGYQVALSLLLQAIQMHASHDLYPLLQQTNTILTKMACNQVSLQGSRSSVPSDDLDIAMDLDLEVSSLQKALQSFDMSSPRRNQSSLQPQPRISRLGADDGGPSILDERKDEFVSPTFKDLKAFQVHRGDKPLSLDTSFGGLNRSEKRDSVQAVYGTPSAFLRRESEASAHSHQTCHSTNTLEPLSPLAWEPNGLDRFASSGPSHATLSTRSGSIQSSFTEVMSDANEKNPFPKVQKPPAFLPLSAEDQQIDLLRRRYTIVTPDDQLRWAEEALHFVAITSRQRDRISRTQSVPAKSIAEERQLESEAKQLVRLHLPFGNGKALFLQASYFGLEPAKSLELFKTSLENGYARSAFYIANMLEADPSVKRSTILEYYREGATANDTACNYRLGEAHLKGELGLKKEHKDAIWYLYQAAEHPDRDFPQALFLLGLLQTERYRQTAKIRDGLLPIDEDAALENFKLGAKLGCSQCQVYLGHAFRTEIHGLTKDSAIALHYFRLAARQGEPEADYQISTYFGWGEPGVVEVHSKLAYTHARRAAEDGYPPALVQVGYFYEKGIGVREDKELAKDWYLMAIAKGDRSAEKRLEALKNRGAIGLAI